MAYNYWIQRCGAIFINIPNIFNNLQHNTTFPETNYNSNSTDYFNPFNATEQTILNPVFNENTANQNEDPTEDPTEDPISNIYDDADNVD